MWLKSKVKNSLNFREYTDKVIKQDADLEWEEKEFNVLGTWIY